MRVALLSANARAGDAIGNQITAKARFFLERNAEVRLFVDDATGLHPVLEPLCHDLAHAEPGDEARAYLLTSDLVVVEFGQSYPALGVLAVLNQGSGKLLLDYHGLTPLEFWDAHNREALEQGYQSRGLAWFADAVLVHSRFALKELREHTGLPPDRFRTLGHLVDAETFHPGGPCVGMRDQLGLQNAHLLLFVGRIAPNKRLAVLVDALHRLREVTPAVHAIVAGDATDVYEQELRRCHELATELGVGNRFHYMGRVADRRLPELYRSADTFVMPSRHEGFCIPVIEAMACGVPVVAARAGALPETVGSAGLTFRPDDAGDLARQIRRLIDAEARPSPAKHPVGTQRWAIVCHRWGTDFVGGAERSLRTVASALSQEGLSVEVFTTCNRAEGDWDNHLPEGTTQEERLAVHRFRIDAHDRARHLESFHSVVEASGPIPEEVERAYLEHSLHSTALLEALRRRKDEFDAILVGPYLFGLSHDVAREFTNAVLLLPCFHDEPLARLTAWREVYEPVGGILYHSPEEQAFAERELGLNHPGGAQLGTLLDDCGHGDPERGRAVAGTGRRYLLYCGRYSEQKNLPLLLSYARRYANEHPDRFLFLFVGEGAVAIPDEPWARNLGFVSEARKADLLAGADGLVQLSEYESLSLTALEAWIQGTPVLAHARCEVLAGQIRRAAGGHTVRDYETFEAALTDLWQHPQTWRQLGTRGREYVLANYGCRQAFTNRLLKAADELRTPLAERLRLRGLERARQFDRPSWRAAFGRIVEDVVDQPSPLRRFRVEFEPRTKERTVSVGQECVYVPVRLTNHGTHPVVHEGPGRTVVRSQVRDESGGPHEGVCAETGLPGLVLPGQSVTLAVSVPVPRMAGSYRVQFEAIPVANGCASSPGTPREAPADSVLRLLVVQAERTTGPGVCSPVLAEVQKALGVAAKRQRLPDGYTDVTGGRFAALKRWVKRKLLNNFKRAYVDVLSRQQSAFNREVLTALRELTECLILLDQRHRETETLRSELAESRLRLAALEQRLAQLEQQQNLTGPRP